MTTNTGLRVPDDVPTNTGISIPDISNYKDNFNNVYLTSPNATYDLPFEQTPESMLDVETYKAFISSALRTFRGSREYKAYKSYLMGLGLDHCQIFGYLGEDELGDNGIQMHHNFLTIWDIAFLITEHMMNTVGHLTTFDLVDLLIREHESNNIPIVMLSETPHELYHADNNNFLPPSMTFGRWWQLLYNYRYGISIDIAKKVIMFVQQFIDDKNYHMMIKLKTDIESFASYNTYGDGPKYLNMVDNPPYNFTPGGN